MADEADQLTEHGIQWVDDTIGRWISQNLTADAIQQALPAYVHERLSLLPEGHDALPMAMAMSMRPEAIREARAWLLSARAQVRRVARLSHPLGMLGEQGPSDEKTGQAVEYEVQAELAELRREIEQNGRNLDAIIERLRRRADAGSRRSADPAA